MSDAKQNFHYTGISQSLNLYCVYVKSLEQMVSVQYSVPLCV